MGGKRLPTNEKVKREIEKLVEHLTFPRGDKKIMLRFITSTSTSLTWRVYPKSSSNDFSKTV